MFLPWPSAELPQGEGKMDDLQAGGKETGRGREIIPSRSREESLLVSMALGTYFSFFFSPCRLVHLAIIHCVPAVALCCIAQLPREVLEIQNDLFQVCCCDRQKMGGREVPQAVPCIAGQSISLSPGPHTCFLQSMVKVPCVQPLCREGKKGGADTLREKCDSSQHCGLKGFFCKAPRHCRQPWKRHGLNVAGRMRSVSWVICELRCRGTASCVTPPV